MHNKNVLEVGAGIGDHSSYFLDRGCSVLTTEVRPENLKIIKQHHPIPLVMISDNDDPEYVEKAVDAGVTTYLLKDFNLLRIKPIISLAIARFKSNQSLRSALNNAETKLESESVIIKAKKMLMEKHKISEDNAHKTLRTLSMDTNLSLPEAARSTINILSKK